MSIDDFSFNVRFAANQDGSFAIPFKPNDVFSALKVAVPQINGFTVSNVLDMSLSMDIKTGMSLRSWGEAIQISVTPSADHNSILNIKSKSHLGTNDWGKNKQNVSKILEALQEELKDPKYQAAQTTSEENDSVAMLLKLKTLLDNGIITNEEFEAKKADLLARL